MRLQFTAHTGGSVTLTRRQTEACERFGDAIDVEEKEALIADDISALIDACIEDTDPLRTGWCWAYHAGQIFLASQIQIARFEWSGGRWLELRRVPH